MWHVIGTTTPRERCRVFDAAMATNASSRSHGNRRSIDFVQVIPVKRVSHYRHSVCVAQQITSKLDSNPVWFVFFICSPRPKSRRLHHHQQPHQQPASVRLAPPATAPKRRRTRRNASVRPGTMCPRIGSWCRCRVCWVSAMAIAN